MKKLTQLTLVLLVMVVAFAGCEAAQEAATNATGFDMAGMQKKFTEIKDGFADVTEENADGLATKIEGFEDSVEEIKVDKLPEAAKTQASGMMTKVADFLKGQMEKLSDKPGIMEKLKPAIEPLMEKLKAFGS